MGCQASNVDVLKLEGGAKDSLICKMNFDDFNNNIYEFWLNQKNPPSADEFRQHLQENLKKDPQWSQTRSEDLTTLLDASSNYYQFIVNDLTQRAGDASEKLELLTALELGDRGDDRAQLQEKWALQKSEFQARLKSLDLPCGDIIRNTPTEASKASGGKFKPRTKLPRAVEGLRVAFATAYQSCRSLQLPALRQMTPPVEGIRVLEQSHPDGVGRKRVYGSIPKILSTHPYYQENFDQKACFDSRSNPLIYDYGGKPKTTTDANSLLDFFNNSGSGTSVLGIDCSGFIFSAIARAGLNLAPNKPLKAVSVNGVSARMFKDPSNNGLTCFGSISINRNNNLRAGDIIASGGHVVMVDQVGADPFGLSRAKSLDDCTASNLSSDGFDFVISHSSPWKDGVGINRSHARDYLPSSDTFRTGLVSFAVAFCKSHYQTTTKVAAPVGDINIVRHRGTPECLTSNTVNLRYESCVAQCPLEDPITL